MKLLAFSNELKHFLDLYQALKVLLKDSTRLLLVSLDIGAQEYAWNLAKL